MRIKPTSPAKVGVVSTIAHVWLGVKLRVEELCGVW